MAGVVSVILPEGKINVLETLSCMFGVTRDTGTSPEAMPSCTPCTSEDAAVDTSFTAPVYVPCVPGVPCTVKTDTRSANSCALPAKYPRLDNEETICNALEQTALPVTEVTSNGENEDSNDDASVLRRDEDASCLAAMSTIAWHSDDLLQQRDNERR